ncbi:hypothetical protein BJV82DRAFT_590955 [Fennellomyces sp. T-0311]|nr:hypothetical protein BJV82DRAFT_590955 [Fennellomyces sp. T-0311]
MRPEDIDRNWPKKVIDLIYELARTNLATADIRAKVQAEFPDISWNERRFYNRLSEERQKIRHREAAVRARRLTNVWGQVCMAAAGNEELSEYVETEITKLLYATCQMAKLDPQTLRQPMFAGELEPPTEQSQTAQVASSSSSSSSVPPHVSSPLQSQSGSGDLPSPTLPPPPKRKGSQSKQKAPAQSSTAPPVSKPPDPPKGFTTVVIPEHTYFVKIHSQRIANEIQLIRNPRRPRSMSTSEEALSSDINFPARKLQKRARTSQQLQPPSELRIAHSPVDASVQPQEQQRPPMLDQQHANFVYHTGYDEQGMPMQSAIPGYDFHRFHQPYSISPTGSTGFAPPPQAPADMPPLQHFDPSNQIVRTTNEPTIHPALQSNPVAHRPPIRRDSAHNMYPLGSAPGVYQLAAAAAVVTSREEEMRQENRDRNLYMHQQHEQHHQILPPYQAEHPPDTPMPGREHKSEPQ